MGRKLVAALPPFGEGERGPHLTQSCLGRGLGQYQVTSDILIHAAIWPQQIWAENWGLCPFGEGELGPHLTQCGQGRGLPTRQVSS